MTRDQESRAIGQALKETRQRRGLSQADVADALGVSQVTVGNWEQGKTEPQGDNLEELNEWLSEPPSTIDNPPCDNCGTTYVPMAMHRVDVGAGASTLICHWCRDEISEEEVVDLAN